MTPVPTLRRPAPPAGGAVTQAALDRIVTDGSGVTLREKPSGRIVAVFNYQSEARAFASLPRVLDSVRRALDLARAGASQREVLAELEVVFALAEVEEGPGEVVKELPATDKAAQPAPVKSQKSKPGKS